MSSIFGGSKSKSTQESYNQAYPFIQQTFAPAASQAVTGSNALAQLLGGDPTGFNAYKQATGYDAALEQGSRGITANAAAGGLLRSGGTARALQAFGDQMQQQYAGNYLDRLAQQVQLGTQIGSLIAGAGQRSTGQSSSNSKNGMGGFIGSLASGIAASDRRLKKNIFKIAELSSGLGLYQYRYIDNSGPHIGVMAQEVAEIMPEALGPTIDGYMTVDYSKIH